MQGHPEISLTFDIENIKRYPNLIEESEEVVYTEKVHGTFIMIGLVHPDLRTKEMVEGKLFISSKGLGSRGLYFKDNSTNQENVYLRAVKLNNLSGKLEQIAYNFTSRPCKQYNLINNEKATVWLLGEVYGVQKGYGYGTNGAVPGFRAFSIKVGHKYISNRDMFESLCKHAEIPITPVLYRGPFSKETLKKYTDGNETVTGHSLHIREGIVVTPVEERFNSEIGRVILKSVSDEYLGKSTGEELS